MRSVLSAPRGALVQAPRAEPGAPRDALVQAPGAGTAPRGAPSSRRPAPGRLLGAPSSRQAPPAPAGFAQLLVGLLDQLEIERAHIAGNSLGGWTALELAKLGRARSVVAVGPAGLWRRGPVRPVIKLSVAYRGARRVRRTVRSLTRVRLARRILLSQAFGDPDRVPADDAVTLVEALARTEGFQ